MRFVRYAVGAAVLAAALTACGANSNANNSAPAGGTVASSAPVKEDNTTLEAPQPPATKWHAAGDLCKLIPGAMAAEVLGQPVTQFTEGQPSWLSDPRVIDECNYVYKDEGGTPRN